MLSKILAYPNVARALRLVDKNFDSYYVTIGMVTMFMVGNAAAGAIALSTWGMTRDGHNAIYALSILSAIVAIVWRFAGRFFNKLWQAEDSSERYVSIRYLVYLPWATLFAMIGTVAMVRALPPNSAIVELGYGLPNLNVTSMVIGLATIGGALAGTAVADAMLQFFRFDFRWTKPNQ